MIEKKINNDFGKSAKENFETLTIKSLFFFLDQFHQPNILIKV